jgi:hypothetical protein
MKMEFWGNVFATLFRYHPLRGRARRKIRQHYDEPRPKSNDYADFVDRDPLEIFNGLGSSAQLRCGAAALLAGA